MGETKLPSGLFGRAWVFPVIIFGALCFLLWPTVGGIFDRWLKLDESYSHGFLLLLVSLVLIFRVVKQRVPVPGFYPWWLVPFVLALLAYGLGELLRVQALRELVVVPLILGALAILIGWKQVRPFIVPIGLLFFAVPVWDYLSWTLQLMTVEVNHFLLGMLDINFEVEGIFVYLIGVGTFEVAHGCSGLRYLLVGQSLALIYGELNFRCLRSRVVFFSVAVLFALIANWIRVFVIIYMGYETNMQTSLIADHDNFGWWVFAATLVPLFFIGRKLEMTRSERTAPEINAQATRDEDYSRRLMVPGSLVTAALPLILLFVLSSSAGQSKTTSDELAIDLDSKNYGPLFGNRLYGWRPQVINPDFAFAQTFFARNAIEKTKVGASQYFLGVYGYEYQRHKAEIIQFSNRLYQNDQWLPEDFYKVVSPSGVQLKGVTLKAVGAEKRMHVAFTYYVGGLWETDQWRAKLAQLGTLLGSRKDASILVFAVGCEICDGHSKVQEFVDNTMPSVVGQIDDMFER